MGVVEKRAIFKLQEILRSMLKLESSHGQETSKMIHKQIILDADAEIRSKIRLTLEITQNVLAEESPGNINVAARKVLARPICPYRSLESVKSIIRGTHPTMVRLGWKSPVDFPWS